MMDVSSQSNQIQIDSPAKINLFLHVVGKRSDGYHDLVSIMQMVELSDEIHFEEISGGIDLHVEGGNLSPDQNNLVYRSAMVLRSAYGLDKGVRITLKKKIPLSAGLGGGSSNAAATLLGLSLLWKVSPSMEVLIRMGETLGADVPFFFRGPLALAMGKGERLYPLQCDRSWGILLVVPGISISTAWAFRAFDEQEMPFQRPFSSHPSSESLFKKWLTKVQDEIKINRFEGHLISSPGQRDPLRNDLEGVAIQRYPVLQEVKDFLVEQGASMALMSGSGASVFGIFEDPENLRKAKKAVRENHSWAVWETRTLLKSPWQALIDRLNGYQ